MMRMYTVAKLSKIVKLDLSNNHLMSIEGLRDLINLTWLDLSHNKIKVKFLFLFIYHIVDI
jgi:Leucine-rich repeat (LRR) protein